MKIAVIGAGNVGGTLGRRWAAKGHQVMFGVRDAVPADLLRASPGATSASVPDATAFGEVVVFATPWPSTRDAVTSAGNLVGKIVLDVTNPINADFTGLAVGLNSSGGELVQSWAPSARVVKIFNTVGFNIMADPNFNGQAATMYYCGDDAEAKQTAAALASDLGFDPVDAGPLTQARTLEPLAWLWISMALQYGHGREMAIHLMKR